MTTNAISVLTNKLANLAPDLNFTLCENHLFASVIYCAFMYASFVYFAYRKCVR